MKFRLTLILMVTLGISAVTHGAGSEVGFLETFVLAQDRQAVLEQLVPGTQNYYLFHALHYQNTGQKQALTTILNQWASRFPDSEDRRIIERREALLGYDADPQKTLRFLKEHLHLELNHTQEVRDQKPNLATKLDPTRLARSVFREAALATDNLDGMTLEELEDLIRDKTPLRPPQLRALMSRLERPDVPGLVERVVEDLRNRESKGFGEWEIHRKLLPNQLDQLGQLLPPIRQQSAFVFAQIRKLAPGADADSISDPEVRAAWLQRLSAYVRGLPPAFNALKATVFHARLQLDRSRGIYDRDGFLEYLKLPRPTPYMNPLYLERQEVGRFPANLNVDFTQQHLELPRVGDDEGLVRDFFLHFAVEEPNWEPWTEWLRDTWVKSAFAEAKITSGVGDPEQWASLISPAAYQALRDRVDIDLSPTNPAFVKPGDEVAVQLTLKQTPKLIVKIFELNTLSFALSQKRQPNTDVNLEGLVANSEQTYEVDASPFRRISKTYKFPELKDKRGAWIIEFIGGGKSSRALIRKGQYSLVQQTGPAGDLLTVLDEAKRPVTNAVAWLDGRKWTPLATTGQILIPFSAEAGRRPIVIAEADGLFATLSQFQQHQEEYSLHVDFHLEREQLLAGREATLAVRPSLWMEKSQLTIDLLTQPKLVLRTVTLDGITSTSEIPIPPGNSNQLFLHHFRVPERLETVEATLAGKVELLGRPGEKKDLSEHRSWSINGIDASEATYDGHLSKFDSAYRFELLGKNGEPLADTRVVFHFHRRGFGHLEEIDLQTDEKGRIDLGPLEEIATVDAQLGNGIQRSWTLTDFARTWPGAIHATPGQSIQIPWSAPVQPNTISLLEERNGEFVSDQSSAVRPTGAFLEVTGLKPGDYSMKLRGDGNPTIQIRVSEGPRVGRWILSANRSLEIRNSAWLQIESALVATNEIVVQLRNWNSFTRVHIAATHYLPGGGLFAGLAGFPRFDPVVSGVERAQSLYARDREIGDEYRYILERRYAAKFPGNLLTRPSLLLNPWKKQETEVAALAQKPGSALAAADALRLQSLGADTERFFGAQRGADLAHPGSPNENLDFLMEASPTRFNLVPDAEGKVRIPRADLGDRQLVQIYAEDLGNAVWGTIHVSTPATRFRDRRLDRPLDPSQRFVQRMAVTLLRPGESLTISDVLTSEWETYDTLGSLYTLFTSLSHDPTLEKFSWVLGWPNLKEDEKRAKYSEFACHELNFFLSRKDPEFFNRAVRPFLANKKDKTFLDEYLLELPLDRYLEPQAFARLNAAEKALLGRRLTTETESIRRHLRELWEILPPNPQEDAERFEGALKGRLLDESAERSKREVEALGRRAAGGAGPSPEVNLEAPSANRPATPMLYDSNATGLGDTTASSDKSPARFSVRKLAKSLSSAQTSPMSHTEYKLGEEFAESAPAYFTRGEAEDQRKRALERAYYRRLEVTKALAENNYYKLSIKEQGPDLIPINRFWVDYAAWDGKAPFLSPHVTEAARHFSEMMLALAVTDLPFQATPATNRWDGNTLILSANSPMIVFHQQFESALPHSDPAGPSLLVSENFYRSGDRYREVGNEKFDNYVTGEFLTGVAYGANVVMSNPGSAPVTLEVLTQIPRGALPLSRSRATQSRYLRLEPYTTQQLDYFFYFPEPPTHSNSFPHFPVNLAVGEHNVGAATSVPFRVVRQLSQVDKTSWPYLSQYGSDDEVFAYLEQHNLQRVDLEKVAWRARTRVDFFRKIVEFLQHHHCWSEPIYRYAVAHNDLPGLRAWLLHQEEFLAGCGPALECPLVTIDPVERGSYEHLEFAPLVNQRVHRFGAAWQVANQGLKRQYSSLLLNLAFRPTLSQSQQLDLVYYLLLQDRVEEALPRFHQLAPNGFPSRLQYDYLRCYVNFYEEKLADARGIAAQYLDYPIDRWRARFAEVTAQLDEIEGRPTTRPDGPPDREQQQSRIAASEPSFDFRVENHQLSFNWKNLREVTLHYYRMDPEFLFSSSPFVSANPDRFSIVQPTLTVQLSLPEGRDTLEVPLPAQFTQANVLVEVLGAGQRKMQAYHANTFKLTIAENYGRLEVRDQNNDKPVTKAYVKVYARLRSGAIRFMKDGYTDLRGKFDYTSINGGASTGSPSPRVREPMENLGGLDNPTLQADEIGSIEKLAVLVLSDSHGAAVREVNPPKS